MYLDLGDSRIGCLENWFHSFNIYMPFVWPYLKRQLLFICSLRRSCMEIGWSFHRNWSVAFISKDLPSEGRTCESSSHMVACDGVSFGSTGASCRPWVNNASPTHLIYRTDNITVTNTPPRGCLMNALVIVDFSTMRHMFAGYRWAVSDNWKCSRALVLNVSPSYAF